ncbi:L-aspartate semialdehyde sulfurtransferase [Desulfovibrionales bacterium]
MGKDYQVKKTIAEINKRIHRGKAIVLNASEMVKTVRELGKVRAAREVDVVTTGTFSPMCSSGLFFNIGQETPLIKVHRMRVNNIPAYCGLAAVDAYLGATEPTKDDPLNKVYPGQFKYGGGHVIEDLVRGKAVHLKCIAYGTDCYPRQTLNKSVTLAQLSFAQLLNPRNCYQNYNVAVNLSNRIIYTYMGPLKPECKNANYATAGELSPLFNDPMFLTVGLGTKIFLGGGIGYVLGAGTQHNPNPPRTARGLPKVPAGTLMVRGDLKGMQSRFLRGISFLGYGCSLAVGVGIPIPVLNDEIAWYTGVSDADIIMPVKDYSNDYPQGISQILGQVTYEELKKGQVEILGKQVQTVPLTSYSMSLEIAEILKGWIKKGEFLLTDAQEKIPAN